VDGSQPKGRRGTVGHPYSALNLRLVLAMIGLVVSLGLAVLAWLADIRWVAIVLAVIALSAVVDIVVVQRRRAARHREEPGESHSLFE
jgi:hypothetical protein